MENNRNAWDDLSMREKAAMIGVAVRNGIVDLQEIRQRYNEFATGGDTEEELKPASVSEARRMGALVGAAPFVRQKSFIGGDRKQTWDKYWQTDNEMYMLTDSVAREYSINPDLLRYRLNNEGYTDAKVKEINNDYKNKTNNTVLGEALFKSDADPRIAGDEFGLDDTADYISEGKAQLINENWGDGDFLNEHGRWTHIAIGNKYSDNIGIMAATLKYFRDLAKKDFPNASNADLDRYAAAYYNRGPKGGREWVKRGAKGYKLKELGGPLVNAAMAHYYDGTKEESQQMQKVSPYRYVQTEDGQWNRVANDEMGRAFQGLIVTPRKVKQKFVPAKIDNSKEGIERREKFYRYRDEEGNLRGELGLEIVSPEFDLLSLGPIWNTVGRQITKIGGRQTLNNGFSKELLSNIEATQWYDNLVKQYGKKNAARIASIVRTPEFSTYFFGEAPSAARKGIEKYANQRDIINKISGDVDRGKAAVSGSAAMIREGSMDRTGAALHDLDLSAYMGNASKTINSSVSIAKHPELFSTEQLTNAPIYETISKAYPTQFGNPKVRVASKLSTELEKLNRWWNNDIKLGKYLPNPFPSSYREGVFNITNIKNVSNAGANRVVMTRINGEPIDIFLSDNYLPTSGNFMSADNVIGWKKHFINNRMKTGRAPRTKDVEDIENFIPFSENNPVISTTGQAQYAPFSFKESVLVNKEGLPILSPVETWPGSGQFVPSFMNYDGEFYPVLNLIK